MKKAGKKIWLIPAGHIPLRSTGKEPDFVSQDRLAILNVSKKKASVTITIFFQDQNEVSDYPITIDAQRLKKIRINDLINPSPVYLETDYSILIESDCEIVVQFTKVQTGAKNLAIMGTMAFGEKD
jgi:hypothetical protein